jgi:hypothetical protein
MSALQKFSVSFILFLVQFDFFFHHFFFFNSFYNHSPALYAAAPPSPKLMEMCQNAHHIASIEVVNTSSKWNDDKNMITTSIEAKVVQVIKGQLPSDIKLSFSGGEMNGEVQSFSNVPDFSAGEKALVLLRKKITTLNPIIHGRHGKISEQRIPQDSNLSLSQFAKRLQTQLSNLSHLNLGKSKPTSSHSLNNLQLTPPNCHCHPSQHPSTGRNKSKKNYHLRSVPIPINPMHKHPEWEGRDIIMMNEWNRYAKVFSPLEKPQPWAWRNGVFDVVGTIDSQQLQELFGLQWEGTYAFTMIRSYTSGEIIEADIFLNPSISWTMDNTSIPFQPSRIGLDLTLIHELGHVLGLQDDFSTLSVMNYAPRVFDGEFSLKLHDLLQLRKLYPSAIKNHSDLGIYLYHPKGQQNYQTASAQLAKAQEFSGADLFISSMTLENLSPNPSSNSFIQWHLSPKYGIAEEATFIGNTSLDSIPAYTQTQSNANIPIQSELNAGYYYVYAKLFMDNDEVPTNSENWLFSPIYVPQQKPDPQLQIQSSSAQFTSQTAAPISTPTAVASSGGGGGGCLLE